MTEEYVEVRGLIRSRDSLPKLDTAQEAALYTGVSADRLKELAACGYAPHIRVDAGEPLFYKKDISAFVRDHLITIHPGKPLPIKVNVLVREAPDCEFDDLPDMLKPMHRFLKRFGAEWIPPCVYFLSNLGRVVYVGQSVNLPSRLQTHNREKDGQFESVFFLPVPIDSLTEVECAFIAALKPPLNGGPKKLKSTHVETLQHYEFLVDGFGSVTSLNIIDQVGNPIVTQIEADVTVGQQATAELSTNEGSIA